MIKRIFTLIEIFAFLACVFMVYKWISSGDSSYEPWFTLFGLVGGGLELIRRFVLSEPSGNLSAYEDSVEAHVDWLLSNIHANEPSTTLPRALRLAKKVGDDDFARWCRFEINGYNTGLKDGEFVPEYRSVTGRYQNAYGQLLHISDPTILYVNQDRPRHGVAELEAFAKKSETLQIYDEQGFALTIKYFNFQPTRFLVDPSAFVGVLGLIKNELFNRVLEVKDRRQQQ
jgi:AbiTii